MSLIRFRVLILDCVPTLNLSINLAFLFPIDDFLRNFTLFLVFLFFFFLCFLSSSKSYSLSSSNISSNRSSITLSSNEDNKPLANKVPSNPLVSFGLKISKGFLILLKEMLEVCLNLIFFFKFSSFLLSFLTKI